MSFHKLKPKDKDETLDYPINWEPRGLEGDTINSFAVTIVDGVGDGELEELPDRRDITGFITTFWLRGGTSGQVYNVLVRIITEAGRICDQTWSVKCLVK